MSMFTSSLSRPGGMSIFASLCEHSSKLAEDMMVRYMVRRRFTRACSDMSEIVCFCTGAGTMASVGSGRSPFSSSSALSSSASDPLPSSESSESESSSPRISFLILAHALSPSSYSASSLNTSSMSCLSSPASSRPISKHTWSSLSTRSREGGTGGGNPRFLSAKAFSMVNWQRLLTSPSCRMPRSLSATAASPLGLSSLRVLPTALKKPTATATESSVGVERRRVRTWRARSSWETPWLHR
mmetsp:Transcript_18612/g.37303  ORF Transcript_18612/g.37303 Transcript_18612/m.37303 type:complete len:242 (-) Transcript_18612:706-1431(-)